jgi:chromosome segregation ATPase
MEPIQAEIAEIRSHIEALRQERNELKVEPVLPSYNSPQAIADAYRRHARETAQMSAEIKGIEDAIAALETQLKQKVAQSLGMPTTRRLNPLEEQVEEGRQRARIHAERINELAAEVAAELKELKAIADEISPSYWQVYYKPFITGFQTISVPHVRSDGDVWTIVNRVV